MRPAVIVLRLAMCLAAGVAMFVQSHADASTAATLVDAGPDVVTLDASLPDAPVITRIVSHSVAYYEEAVADKRAILIAKIALTKALSLTLTETPQEAIGFYRSSIVVTNGSGAVREVPVGERFSDQSLSLAYIAIVKKGADEVVVVLNYMSQPSEVNEGFVVVRAKADGIQVDALPLTTFGKLVFRGATGNRLELWSADSKKIGTANDPVRYIVRRCQWESTSYDCGKRTFPGRMIAPNAIIHPGIEVRSR